MTNFKILVQYDGTRYQGWQRLGTTDNTIQGKIESVLSKMCEHQVEIHGAGRTDAGVHALGQVANFRIKTDKTPEQIKEYLNQYLPQDIGVVSCEEVPERFHARLHPHFKHYRYRLWDAQEKNIFERKYLTVWQQELDVQAMIQAAKLFCGTHDFRGFSSVNKRFKKSTIRTISEIQIQRIGGEVRLDFYGDGFLYHMVRILTGTLVEIGTNKREESSILAAFESLDRQDAGITMPPQGLILQKITYDR